MAANLHMSGLHVSTADAKGRIQKALRKGRSILNNRCFGK